MWKTCCGIYPCYWLLLPSSTSNIQESFVLRTPRRSWYSSAPHYFLHVWNPCSGALGGRDHSQSQHHVCGFPSTSGLTYWISCQCTVFQICLCALCYCTGYCSVCSHQVLVGQPTNKKSVFILLPPPTLTPSLLIERIEMNSLLALLQKW